VKGGDRLEKLQKAIRLLKEVKEEPNKAGAALDWTIELTPIPYREATVEGFCRNFRQNTDDLLRCTKK
jgi:hypothetical protein